MTQYQILLQDENYNKLAFIKTYKRLTFTQVLNDIGHAVLELHPDDPLINLLALPYPPQTGGMKRLQIVRDGVIEFGGVLLKESWEIPQEAPTGETWTCYALDYGVYLDWRIVVPVSGISHDERTDHADDLAKAYVRAHVADAACERQFADLAVHGDQHRANVITERGRYCTVLSLVQKLAEKGGFDWRCVPLARGALFKTAYPYWGVDRRKGNGVNDECVFALDRRNFIEMSYTLDLLEHDNCIYVGGQGEGEGRAIVKVTDSDYIDCYWQREAFVDARHLELVSSLQNYGQAEIEARKPARQMAVQPRSDTWKTLWDLGDVVTIYAKIADRQFQMDGQITAVSVEVTPDNLETVRVTVKAV